MDNRTALFLAILIVGFLVADYVWLEWDVLNSAARLLVRLMDWLAFWR